MGYQVAEAPAAEKRKSFDLVANVEAFARDLDAYGYVLPETREQVGNEQLSYLAEGIDRAARTTFVFQKEGEDLVYFDDGRGRPYSHMLQTGLEVARAEAMIDPRRQFLADWAQNDYFHYSQMRRLHPGEQYVWANPYPHDMEARYGVQFMRECGLRPERKMGFLYRARCNDDGGIVLESQTIDRSDCEAISAAMREASSDRSANMDALVHAYDAALSRKYGDYFYAGRREAELNENAWEQIKHNRDLVEYLLNGLESLARKSLLPGELENETKRHIYGVWALFKKRLEGRAQALIDSSQVWSSSDYMATQMWLAQEVHDAYTEFASKGEVLVGCGGSVSAFSGESNILDASAKDVLSSIFNGGAGQDRYGSLQFKCPKGHINTRPRNKLIEKCQKCGTSVRC